MVETSSLAAVQPPDVSYQLHLDELVQGGGLSGLQLESITYACQRHEQLLPDGSRAGFFIGDGAGVGKGRTIAGAPGCYAGLSPSEPQGQPSCGQGVLTLLLICWICVYAYDKSRPGELGSSCSRTAARPAPGRLADFLHSCLIHLSFLRLCFLRPCQACSVSRLLKGRNCMPLEGKAPC